jgi:hypothetical protein
MGIPFIAHISWGITYYSPLAIGSSIWRRCVGFPWKVFAQVSLLWLVFKIVTYNVYVCFEWV